MDNVSSDAGCLKFFRINKTLKLWTTQSNKEDSLKFFRINKTLKPCQCSRSAPWGLKFFRINKTLKPQIQFSPSRYLLAIEGC